VGGDGPLDAEVLIIGEAPGKAEERTGKPFCGESEKLLRDRINRYGFPSVRYTNIVRCRPPDNRTPTPDEVKACREYLDAEVAAVKPRAILTVGTPASKSVLNKAKVTQFHGQIIERDGLITMPAYHPAYCLRDPSKLPAFETDLQRLARYLQGEKRSATVEWAIVDRHNLDRFLADLRRCTEFSFDTETPGLDWFRPDLRYLRSLQLGLAFEDGSDFGWVIPMNVLGSPFHTPELQRQIAWMIYEILKDKYAIAHNGKFDTLWLQACFGLKFYLSFDTMLASHTLNENRAHGLKELVRAELDEPDKALPTGVLELQLVAVLDDRWAAHRPGVQYERARHVQEPMVGNRPKEHASQRTHASRPHPSELEEDQADKGFALE